MKAGANTPVHTVMARCAFPRRIISRTQKLQEKYLRKIMMFAGYYDISTHKMRKKNNKVSKYLNKFSHKSILLSGSFGFQDSADGYFWDIGKHQPMEDAPRKYWIQNGSNSKNWGSDNLIHFKTTSQKTQISVIFGTHFQVNH